MKIVLQSATSRSGTTSRQDLARLKKDQVIIGRGGASELLIAHPSVDPEHARLIGTAEGLRIEDLGAVGGTIVDGTPVQSAALRDKSRVRLGTVEILVLQEGDTWCLLIEENATPPKSTEKFDPIAAAAKLDIRTRVPPIRSVILAALVLTVAVTLLFPLATHNESTWSSGPIANVHQHRAGDCRTCHAGGFSKVANESCITCHTMSEHTDTKSEARCASCHLEHSGDHNLRSGDNALCLSCHQDIKHEKADTQLQKVTSFDSHPEFAVTLGEGRHLIRGAGIVRDLTTIRLNHKVHLAANLKGPDGPEQLTCQSCHAVSATKTTMEPISMERNCARCHPLEYDERLPAEQVPHGDPDMVFRFLSAGYTKILAGTTNAQPLSAPSRVRPGHTEPAAPLARESLNVKAIEAAARSAEEMLFTRTACHLCHEISEREGEHERIMSEGLSRFIVHTPKLPTIWFPKARFAHEKHLTMECSECHHDVEASTKTEDVLLPPVATCQECHGDSRGHGKVESSCTMCHSFHDQEVHGGR